MTILTGLLMVWFTILPLLLIRIEVAHRIGIALLDCVHELNLTMIKRGATCLLSYNELPSFNALMFDLTIWTRNQGMRRYIAPQLEARGFHDTAAVARGELE